MYRINYMIALWLCHRFISIAFIYLLPFSIKSTNTIKKLFAFYISVFGLPYCKHKYFYRNKILCYIGSTITGCILRAQRGRKTIPGFPRSSPDISTWRFSFLTWTHVRFKLAMRTRCTLPVNHRGKSAEHAEEEEYWIYISWMQQPC
jgi:hypothetical protein